MVKSTCPASRGHRLGPRTMTGDSLLRDRTASSGLQRHCTHSVYTHRYTHTQGKDLNKNTVSCRSAFKRLFLHKTKDKKPSLEGVEEMESNGGQVAQEASAKKNLEGWLVPCNFQNQLPSHAYSCQVLVAVSEPWEWT